MKTRTWFFRIIFVSATFFAPVFVFAASGGIDTMYKYAWSENFGWLNFNVVSGNVQVTDTQLTGFVWNDETAWINLNPSSSVYVHNDGQGNLSGYAWGEGVGYINFAGVTIDSLGYFHGFATTDDGSKISFNCLNTNTCASSDFKVKTFWQSTTTPPPGGGGSGGGGGGGGGPVVPGVPVSTSTPSTPSP